MNAMSRKILEKKQAREAEGGNDDDTRSGVFEVYGQSEGGCAVSMSIGQKSMGGVRCPAVRIMDPDTGEILGAGMVGEITYKSDSHMIGYLNHPEENARVANQIANIS